MFFPWLYMFSSGFSYCHFIVKRFGRRAVTIHFDWSNAILIGCCCVVVGYQMNVVYFGWVDSPMEVQEGVEPLQFSLVGKQLYDCSTNYTTGKKLDWQLHYATRSRCCTLFFMIIIKSCRLSEESLTSHRTHRSCRRPIDTGSLVNLLFSSGWPAT